ncbi:MAG TPA: NAD(P)-binding domain-containing protein [Nocardioidaceae bacterium]|nr:NAD(P)-binding domain-containing protein [Nocardioidaceae bacterium]
MSTLPSPDDCLDTLVVGAGQAGLAMAWHLAQRDQRFLVVDGAPELGHSWRSRWDSLRLFSPTQYDGLPGMPFPAPADSYPGKDEVADYLREYATRFELPVLLGTAVARLERTAAGFTAHTAQGPLRARRVVVATGAFQRPAVPEVATGLGPEVTQLHSSAYRNPGQVPAGRVLVVGAGNSGLQIAEELAATHPVVVSAGSRPASLPQRFLGRDLFWWMTRLGMLERTADSGLARRLRARGDLVIGSSRRRLRHAGVEFRPRVVAASGAEVRFADGTSDRPAAVVWATGFRSDHTWIDVPGVLRDGSVVHRRGITDVPGLYFLGLPWQRTRGSSLLGFVQHDAAWLAEQMAARQEVRPVITGALDPGRIREVSAGSRSSTATSGATR